MVGLDSKGSLSCLEVFEAQLPKGGFLAGDGMSANAILPPSQTQDVLSVLANSFLGGMFFLSQLPLALMGMVLAGSGGAFWGL